MISEQRARKKINRLLEYSARENQWASQARLHGRLKIDDAHNVATCKFLSLINSMGALLSVFKKLILSDSGGVNLHHNRSTFICGCGNVQSKDSDTSESMVSLNMEERSSLAKSD